MTNGSMDLGDVAARASHIDVACSRCDRKGRYQLARLVHTLGADFPMTDLGMTAYLKNGGTLENAAAMANHASTRTTQLYDLRRDDISLDEIERIRL